MSNAMDRSWFVQEAARIMGDFFVEDWDSGGDPIRLDEDQLEFEDRIEELLFDCPSSEVWDDADPIQKNALMTEIDERAYQRFLVRRRYTKWTQPGLPL